MRPNRAKGGRDFDTILFIGWVKGEGDPGPRCGQDRAEVQVAEEERLVRGTGLARGAGATISPGAWNVSSVKLKRKWIGSAKGVILRTLPSVPVVSPATSPRTHLPTPLDLLQVVGLQLALLIPMMTHTTTTLLQPLVIENTLPVTILLQETSRVTTLHLLDAEITLLNMLLPALLQEEPVLHHQLMMSGCVSSVGPQTMLTERDVSPALAPDQEQPEGR